MDKDELRHILRGFLDKNDCMTAFPVKRKMKVYALFWLAQYFEAGKVYSEKEINAIIREHTTFDDPATLRRELFDNRFLNRQSDGKEYWLEEKKPLITDFKLD